LGRRFETPFKIIDYEPNRRYAHRGTEEHPVPVTMVFAYKPLSSDGTRFTPRIEAEPGGFFGLLEPVLMNFRELRHSEVRRTGIATPDGPGPSAGSYYRRAT
jgi:hypothetical protein